MTATMTALFGGTGPHWTPRQVPVPQPGPGQIVVRAHAVALNNADAAMLEAADPTAGGSGKEYQAGYEFAGQVTAVGDGVDTIAVGRRVMGTAPASFAQYVPADHRHVLPIPDGLDDTEACALPTGLLTEHGALMTGGFRPGQSVLITGATSSIGLIGLQIVRALGTGQIIATTRSAAKRDLLKQAGADTVIITGEHDLSQSVLDATAGKGVDLTLDHVGGQTFAACLPATAVDGAVVNIGRLDQAATTIDLDALSYRHLRVHGVSFGFTRATELGAVIAAAGQDLLPPVSDGRVRPLIDSILSFDTVDQAVTRLRSHRALGKIVLTVP
ncbi:quinone oxidoreductase family protein [Streptomyces fulvoviolaceus]|uniref:quinone oxidoreductase family protein n=1 Tax=Streptomyces fulvoviolaceus TaxID=285535 RepID=UPI0021C08BE5|nr:zinc-binding dehydrogenase [Streptomyces fulvoviolaceus]MCT9075962.1 zinc-binding dehydrogenase [Streptomyces fulvoviolaceus]